MKRTCVLSRDGLFVVIKRCRRTAAVRLHSRDVIVHGEALHLFWNQCDGCGIWIPFGQATDSAAAHIEIRAAELAQWAAEHPFDQITTICDGGEFTGWLISISNSMAPVPDDDPEAQAGYLAGEIVTHDVRAWLNNEEPYRPRHVHPRRRAA